MLLPANSGNIFLRERLSFFIFQHWSDAADNVLTVQYRYAATYTEALLLQESFVRHNCPGDGWVEAGIQMGGSDSGWGIFTDSGKSELSDTGDRCYRITERTADDPISIQQEDQRNVCILFLKKAVSIGCFTQREVQLSFNQC